MLHGIVVSGRYLGPFGAENCGGAIPDHAGKYLQMSPLAPVGSRGAFSGQRIFGIDPDGGDN